MQGASSILVRIALAVLIPGLTALTRLHAADRKFVVPSDAALVNHWPGRDEYLGTTDDTVSSSLSGIARSSPNRDGFYGYLATSLYGQSDPVLPAGQDTVTFVSGTLVIDDAAFIAKDVPLIKSIEFNGTELFPGHGPYSVRLTKPGPGVFSRAGQKYSFNTAFDFEGTFAAGPAKATNAHTTGVVYLIEAADFASALPNPAPADPLKDYINNVALPLARRKGASALVCGRLQTSTQGSLPGTTGYFPPLNAFGTCIALEFAPVITPPTLTIRLSSGSPLVEWTAIAGRKYTVLATSSLGSPFQPLVTGLTETRFLDLSAPAAGRRFYRVAAE